MRLGNWATRIRRAAFIVFILTSITAASGIGQSQPVDEATELQADKSIPREFRLGDKHIYRVALQAGDYLKLIVSQKSINVAVSLLGPNGEKLADANARRTGPEQIFWIASTSGLHRIEITSKRRCDPADKGACAGIYELTLAGPRKASAEDIRRFQLQDLIRAARPAGPAWDEASPLRLLRIAKLEKVSQLAQSLGETAVAANCEEEMGYAYGLETESGKSVEHYEKSRSLWRSAGEVSEEIRLLLQLGFRYNFLGERQRGFDAVTEALELSRTSGDKHSEINVRFSLASRLLGLNEPRRALAQYEELFRMARETKTDDFGALTGMARVYDRLGEPENATRRRREAIASIYAAGYAADDSLLYYGLARLHGELGEHKKEAEFYEKEYELTKAAASPFDHISPLANIGNAYFNGGDYSKALDYLHRALEICRKVGHRLLLSALLGSLGDVYLASDDPAKAIEYYKESASLINNDLSRETTSAFNLARAYRAAGDNTGALSIAQKLIATIESQRANILSAELSSSFFSSAQKYYLFYIDLLMHLHKQDPRAGHAGMALNIVERAKARSLIQTLKTASADITKGVDPKLLKDEEIIRRQLNEAGNRQTRLLTTKFAQAQLDSLEKEIGSLTDKLSQIQTQIKRTSPSYAAITQPQPLTTIEIQNELLDNETILLEYLLGDERSYLWKVTAQSVQAYELPKREDIERSARIVYSLLNDTKRWSSDARIRAEYDIASARLSETVLGPVAKEINGKRLMIIADGALQYVPFGALPRPSGNPSDRKGRTSSEPMAAGNEIVSLPSASTLFVLRREFANRERAQNSVAIIADPVFSENDERLVTTITARPKKNDDLSKMALERAFNFTGEANAPISIPRLPFTRREAELIFGYAPRNASLKALDFDADREKLLKADLSKYRIVHFATHGILHSEHPELSGIVLSLVNQKGEPVNGFLRSNEIYNLNLNAELVVLSACQTALGKEVRGEGLIGLTRGFMYAGTPRVVASLWKVDDVATAELMKIFYQKMLREKMRPAAALRAAKMEMIKSKRWNAPYYWAAFELQGEWR